MKYRSKPFEVEAVQFKWTTWDELLPRKWKAIFKNKPSLYGLPSQLNMDSGDWIIKDGDTFSVCSDEEFRRKFEEIK